MATHKVFPLTIPSPDGQFSICRTALYSYRIGKDFDPLMKPVLATRAAAFIRAEDVMNQNLVRFSQTGPGATLIVQPYSRNRATRPQAELIVLALAAGLHDFPGPHAAKLQCRVNEAVNTTTFRFLLPQRGKVGTILHPIAELLPATLLPLVMGSAIQVSGLPLQLRLLRLLLLAYLAGAGATEV
jgi:hypothetical protein